MRRLRSMIILLPLLVGSAVPDAEPNHPRIEDCPLDVDPNMVVGKLLAWVRVELGKEMVHTRTWRDPNGDSARVGIVSGPDGLRIINKPRTNSYTILWTPRQMGVAAIVVRVTDDPPSGKPLTDTGTILVQVVPRGRRTAPRGCGSPPG